MSLLRRAASYGIFLLFLGVNFAQLSFGQAKSLQLDSLELPVNWRSIDMPGGVNLRTIAAGSDGSLWVGAMASAARYNGVSWTDYPLPRGEEDGPFKALHVRDSGEVVGLTGSGLYVLENGTWRQIVELEGSVSPAGCLFESTEGDLWFGHELGFGVLMANGESRLAPPGNSAVDFCEDAEGAIWWVEGASRKVFRAEGSAEEIVTTRVREEMLPEHDSPVGFSSLISTSDGKVWFGDIKGGSRVRYFDLKTEEWTFVYLNEDTRGTIVYDMAVGPEGNAWVCSSDSLYRIKDGKVDVFEKYVSGNSQDVDVFQFDSNNGLWHGSVRGGLTYLSLEKSPWRQFDGYHFQCEAFGYRWFTTEFGKVVRAQDDSDAVLAIEDPNLIDTAVGLFVSRTGEIWAIGAHKRVAAVSVFDGEEWELQRFPAFATKFDYDSFCELDDGTVILGSGQSWGSLPKKQAGMLKTRRGGKKWWSEVLPANEDGIPWRVHEIVSDDEGVLYSGGSRMMRISGDDVNVENNRLGAPGSWINSLKMGPERTLWGASFGKGIFQISDDGTRWFRTFEDGLEDLSVIDLSILKNGDVVALTSNAVYRFDGDQWVESLKLPFARPLPEGGGALRVAADGALWINLVHPSWYMRKRLNRSIPWSSEVPFFSYRYEFDFTAPTTTLRRVATSEANSRSFIGRMEGADYYSRTNKSDLQFSYRIDGGAWTPFSDSHSVVFQELSEGTHRIEARSRDLDFNVDSVGSFIDLTIAIPFWKESWFYPMLVVFSVAGLGVYVLGIRHRAKNLLALEQQKLSFFTNISHEIRTPLALVMAPLERAMRLSEKEEVQGYLKRARKASDELKRIVDQLLDFRRAQSGVMKVRPEHADVAVFVSDFAKSMSVMAGERGQSVVFESSLQSLPGKVDVGKLRSILNNLVLNALHYSPDGAVVRVSLRVKNGDRSKFYIAVEDRGIGMSPDFVKLALKPFARGGDERSRSVKGTGIGLAYVNELLEVCGGSIEIESPLEPENEEYPGSRVSFAFPMQPLEETASEVLDSFEASAVDEDQDSDEGLPVLLIVEDDKEMGDFLCRELGESYRTIWRQDGVSGVECARETIPDIVLTDRMMPKMDGFELCRALRADLATAHIPIIMLTAASSERNEIEGLRAGANAFLGKPFSIEALEQRLANQLSIRDGLRTKLKVELERSLVEEQVTEVEDPFLVRANEIVEEQLGDYEFDAEILAQKLGMSRRSLYRRLKATADVSAANFIRTRRMRRAGQLLLSTDMRVGEVMDAVGILEQRTFNKWFKSMFGGTPTEYRASRQKRTADSESAS
ncbi:response regulator [Pelagicoccus mobilis]|uniref:histidine kinase n=1 Tax=Pelagicoccus mobilis TaxID=415221 RepID=A0A934VTI6_9BACT|nr:response regulator [Pelagicoccus mobilis]MBK1879758.1 helix-turn-helix domain-containing protein [Pelagicoccus mobilis]